MGRAARKRRVTAFQFRSGHHTSGLRRSDAVGWFNLKLFNHRHGPIHIVPGFQLSPLLRSYCEPNGCNGHRHANSPPFGTHRPHRTDLSILALSSIHCSSSTNTSTTPPNASYAATLATSPTGTLCDSCCCRSRMLLQRGASSSRASRTILSKIESYSRSYSRSSCS